MGPFVRNENKTNKIMIRLLIALAPLILFSVYKNGYIPYVNDKISFIELFYPLLFILIGAITSFAFETLYALIFKRKEFKNYISNSYSYFPGLFLALILPLNIPIYVLIIGALIGSLSKVIFGGFGKNIFNPALIGYIFVMILFGSFFTTKYYFNSYELDAISTATPLTNASMVSGIGTYEQLVKPYGSLLDFLIGTIPGSLVETSALLCIVAYIYLSLTGTIKWRIPLVYVSTVFVITLGIGRLLGQGIYYPLFHILSGGLMFGAVFMATDPVTSAVTPFGQVIQGLVLGLLTVVLRVVGVEGVAISILVVNALVFIFDKIGAKTRFNFFKSAVWIVLLAMISIMSILGLAAIKRGSGNADPNFDIISKEKVNNQIVYNVSQKGYGGSIKAEIVIENDKIISINITSHRETKDRYQMVIENNYIDRLIKNQNNLEQLDTVSGATVTSNALIKMISNVMDDYK